MCNQTVLKYRNQTLGGHQGDQWSEQLRPSLVLDRSQRQTTQGKHGTSISISDMNQGLRCNHTTCCTTMAVSSRTVGMRTL